MGNTIMKAFLHTPADITLRVIVAFFFSGIVILAILAPLTQAINGYPSGEGIYSLFSPVCHQYPLRSLWILDRPCALCARCISGYTGIVFAAVFIRPHKSYRVRALLGFVFLSLAVIDPIIQLLTPYESTNVVRILTGLLGGCGTFLIIYPQIGRT